MSTEAQIKSTKKAMEGHQEKPMTFDPTKPAQTESGEKARIICSNMKGNYPIVAVIERIDGSEYLAKFTKEGLSFQTIYIGNMVSDNLINIPEPKSIDVHVGGVYKARNGDVGICFQKEEDGLHRTYLLARKDWCWTQGYGKFLSWGDHELDLIEHLGDIQNIHEHIKEKMK